MDGAVTADESGAAASRVRPVVCLERVVGEAQVVVTAGDDNGFSLYLGRGGACRMKMPEASPESGLLDGL